MTSPTNPRIDYGHALLLAHITGPDPYWYLRRDNWERPVPTRRRPQPINHGYYIAWARHWLLRHILSDPSS